MVKRSLGLPYRGGKGAFASEIIGTLPTGKRFVDLFGGGGALTHAAFISGRYSEIVYNELDPLVFKYFENSYNGVYLDEKYDDFWATKEEFDALKDTDPYVRFCWSFNNNSKDYLYSKKKAESTDRSILGNDVYKPAQRLFRCREISKLKSGGTLGIRVTLSNKSYNDVAIEEDDVVYCDPPYNNTTKDGYSENFNHEEFYEWARNTPCFISEYEMPDDFKIVWHKLICTGATAKGRSQRAMENLYVSPKGLERWKESLNVIE